MEIKSFTLIFFTSLFLSSVSAQITVSASVLPTIGDQDVRVITTSIQDVDAEYGSGGEDEIYSFSGLSGTSIVQQNFLNPEEVDVNGLFPEANLARTSLGRMYSELIVREDAGLRVIGAISPNPLNMEMTIKWVVEGDYYLLETPMDYEDVTEQETSISATMPSNVLPDSIVNSFPIQIDSLRFKYKIKTESNIDGYGRLYINDFNSVDVLRQDYYEYINPRIEAYSPLLSWLDITQIVKENFPELGGFLQEVTIQAFRYYKEDSGFSVLEAMSDESGENVANISYRETDLTTFITTPMSDDSYGYDISLNPNPSDGKVTLEVNVDRPGDYTVRVLNIIGYQLWSKDYFINDILREELDFRNLRRGTYFYSLVSPEGKTLVTKRMLIIGA